MSGRTPKKTLGHVIEVGSFGRRRKPIEPFSFERRRLYLLVHSLRGVDILRDRVLELRQYEVR